MSECDKLKLKKMYKCDIGEYTDTKECLDNDRYASFCKISKRNGLCDNQFVKMNCKKTCNNCNVCMDNYGGKKCKKLSYDGRCCEKEVMKNCTKTCNLCGIIWFNEKYISELTNC